MVASPWVSRSTSPPPEAAISRSSLSPLEELVTDNDEPPEVEPERTLQDLMLLDDREVWTNSYAYSKRKVRKSFVNVCRLCKNFRQFVAIFTSKSCQSLSMFGKVRKSFVSLLFLTYVLRHLPSYSCKKYRNVSLIFGLLSKITYVLIFLCTFSSWPKKCRKSFVIFRTML